MINYDLKEIIKCKHCGQKEYWGNMIWLNGSTFCRACYTKEKGLSAYEYSDIEKIELCR